MSQIAKQGAEMFSHIRQSFNSLLTDICRELICFVEKLASSTGYTLTLWTNIAKLRPFSVYTSGVGLGSARKERYKAERNCAYGMQKAEVCIKPPSTWPATAEFGLGPYGSRDEFRYLGLLSHVC